MIIRIPAVACRRETRVLGSRFIAHVTPVADEAGATAVREALQDEFPDATHHCWGVTVRTTQGNRERSDDAGEPGGTAGLPILQAIRGAGISNALVVVVRYFGGSKLGRGGLARAYRDAARAALEAAGVAEIATVARLRLEGPVVGDGEVRHLLARHAGRVIQAAYAEQGTVTLVIEVPDAAAGRLREDLGRVTRGAWAAREDPQPTGRHG